jgi:segregation and condensation protein B
MFGTTEEFLEVFNLADIGQLPPEHELAELATRPEVAAIADIKSVVFGGDRKKFDFDELEELDKLSESIKDIASETDFTMLLKQEEKRRIDGSETGPKMSAFDILEEFVRKDETVKQMRQAVASEMVMTAIEPKLADVAFEGLHNVPELDEEWDAIQKAEWNSISEELVSSQDQDSLAGEAHELEMALEHAFEQLTGESLSDTEVEQNLDASVESLDFTVDSAIKKGVEMDLDLSFLNEALPPDDNSDVTE